jgi:subtilisin family serine protease
VIDHIEVDISLLKDRDLVTQEGAPWGLGAISHREPGSDEYIYDEAAGDGTFAYVVDSGIRETHEQFEGRATAAWTAFEGDHEDTDGHGTHVAGTIAGRDFGVAKKAHVLAAKVFQGDSSSTSIIMDGISWAIDDIVARNRTGKAVVNLSLGGDRSLMVDDLVNDGAASGVVIVAAAGNDNQPVSTVSPASAERAITVGAINSDFEIWVDNAKQGSNFGPEIDIFAPGAKVLSAGVASDDAEIAFTGTSMASPHVAGLVLYAMSVDKISGVETITERLLENGTPDVIKGDLRESVNLLANNGNSQQ